MSKISRRAFFTSLAGTVVAILGALSVFTVVAYLRPKKEEETRNVLKDADGQPILAHALENAAWVIGFSEKGPTIVLKGAGDLRGFSAVCTHLGCLVKWLPQSNEFFCPCHAGRFDSNGNVVSGPPPSPLPRYRVTVTSEEYMLLEA